MKRPLRDVAHSVRARLQNLAKARKRPVAELMHRFAIERFLFRLASSPYRDRFLLKGALMLVAWRAPLARPTMDIDLLGKTGNDLGKLVQTVREICSQSVPDDGMLFEAPTVEGEHITVKADYVGVRVRFRARLGSARFPMQIDIGFGDVVCNPEHALSFPTLLDFPAPELHGYSQESAISEKLHAMVQHGELNSRMKDYFDIWLLAEHYSFRGDRLVQAIAETFAGRGTAIQGEPVGLTMSFADLPGKREQWQAFVRRLQDAGAPASLSAAVASLRRFLLPPLAALQSASGWTAHWQAGGPWH